ncbi:hypothetical protein C8R44DRAFT_742798 [Mycena epipterygia]|nr:hypothetical protein C8R44DRAFT_742798 [Mycena epipterygia]
MTRGALPGGGEGWGASASVGGGADGGGRGGEVRKGSEGGEGGDVRAGAHWVRVSVRLLLRRRLSLRAYAYAGFHARRRVLRSNTLLYSSSHLRRTLDLNFCAEGEALNNRGFLHGLSGRTLDLNFCAGFGIAGLYLAISRDFVPPGCRLPAQPWGFFLRLLSADCGILGVKFQRWDILPALFSEFHFLDEERHCYRFD